MKLRTSKLILNTDSYHRFIELVGIITKKSPCERCHNKRKGTRKISPIDVNTLCNTCKKEIRCFL